MCHQDFSANFYPAFGSIRELFGDNQPQIVGNIFSRSAITASCALHKNAVFIHEGHSEAVNLHFAHITAGVLNTPEKVSEFIRCEYVI